MALSAATRSRRVSGHLFLRFHAALPRLLTPHCSGEDSPAPSALQPLPDSRSRHPVLPQSSGRAQARTLFPFGVHLAVTGAGLSRRGFFSSPSDRASDAGAVLNDAADAAVVSSAPASFPSEVALAAKESSLPVAAVQYLIDAVHSYTGLNWALSIAISTVLLRSVLFTLYLYSMKQIFAKKKEILEVTNLLYRNFVDTFLLKAKDEISQESVKKGWSVFRRLTIPISITCLPSFTFVVLYFAISNMVHKLPSFKEGGAFWFTDLTTPDALYIFPAVISLLLLLRLEFVLHYSRKKRSNKMAILQTLFVLTFPLAASLPQAICTYFVTWGFSSLIQSLVLNQPDMKKLLGDDSTKPTRPSSEPPERAKRRF